MVGSGSKKTASLQVPNVEIDLSVQVFSVIAFHSPQRYF